jgi:hypothetical protein
MPLGIEIHRHVPATACLTVIVGVHLRLWAETFLRGPGFDQRAVNAKMLIGHQTIAFRDRHHPAEKLPCQGFGQQAVTVLRKRRVIPDGLVHVQANKPPEQQVEVQLLHELPFAAHGIEYLQQARPQQPLRRDGRSARPAV